MKATILRIQRTLSLVVCLLITTHVHALEAIIDGLVYGVGVGGSKKEAEQNAAKEAYMKRAE